MMSQDCTITSILSSSSDVAARVLDTLNAGVYVTDVQRRIVYWNQTAERITGWEAGAILGRACHDQVLKHVDKDGRPLCGEEFCPLHRAIVTGTASEVPVIVFALTADGTRIPMRVSVAPLRDPAGRIVGGVETFLDMSAELDDLRRAQRIQSQCLVNEAQGDPRLAVKVYYAPHDIIGGDFCALSRTGPDRYAFLLADVMGHGLSAALYTMYLRSLWDEHCGQATSAAILTTINQRLGSVMIAGSAFATAVGGVLDMSQGRLSVSSAGGPSVLHFAASGGDPVLHLSGLPLGILDESEYEQVERPIEPGDRVLLFSDGAVEIADREGKLLGYKGMLDLLDQLGYPQADLDVRAMEQQMLAYSSAIRLGDDLTVMDIRIGR